MTPELNEQAKAALSQLLTDVQAMREFTIEQTPDVVQQMVAFEATMAWLAIGFIAAGVIVWIAFFRWACRKETILSAESHDENGFYYFISAASGILLTVFGGMCVAMNLPTAIKATFFPKWFIVEKLTQLLS